MTCLPPAGTARSHTLGRIRAFVPRPVYAVLMLFPITKAYEEARKEKDELVRSDGSAEGLTFFKQTIGNACGGSLY